MNKHRTEVSKQTILATAQSMSYRKQPIKEGEMFLSRHTPKQKIYKSFISTSAGKKKKQYVVCVFISYDV